MMTRRGLLGAVLLPWAATGQSSLTVDQLMAFVRSSVQLRLEDRKMAEYLKKAKVTQKITDAALEEMIGYGAGPRTMQALRDLQATTANLAEPAKKDPKPVVQGPPPPPMDTQAQLLDQVTEYARNYVKRLPDFLCTQVTRRYYDPAGLEFWKLEDTIVEKLSYADKTEDYQVILINNKPVVGMSHEQMGGTTSRGEFGSHMRDLFDPETRADFQWERWATLRGRRMHVFAYRVLMARSKYQIVYQRSQSLIAGYRGFVYADADTGLIMRLTLETEDIPPDFPIQEVRQTVDYDLTKIGESEYVLPLKSVVRSRTGRFLVKNEIEFRNYRKFGTESTITFEPEPLPETLTQEKPPTTQRTPK
jgi:hypothetical protein